MATRGEAAAKGRWQREEEQENIDCWRSEREDREEEEKWVYWQEGGTKKSGFLGRGKVYLYFIFYKYI